MFRGALDGKRHARDSCHKPLAWWSTPRQQSARDWPRGRWESYAVGRPAVAVSCHHWHPDERDAGGMRRQATRNRREVLNHEIDVVQGSPRWRSQNTLVGGSSVPMTRRPRSSTEADTDCDSARADSIVIPGFSQATPSFHEVFARAARLPGIAPASPRCREAKPVPDTIGMPIAACTSSPRRSAASQTPVQTPTSSSARIAKPSSRPGTRGRLPGTKAGVSPSPQMVPSCARPVVVRHHG